MIYFTACVSATGVRPYSYFILVLMYVLQNENVLIQQLKKIHMKNLNLGIGPFSIVLDAFLTTVASNSILLRNVSTSPKLIGLQIIILLIQALFPVQLTITQVRDFPQSLSIFNARILIEFPKKRVNYFC